MAFDPDKYLSDGQKQSGFDPDAYLAAAPERSTATKLMRGAEQFSRGFSDSALETIGALPDLVAQGLGAVGLKVSDDPRFYSNALKRGFRDVGKVISAPLNAAMPGAGSMRPENKTEEFMYGAGRGVADAASFAVPASVVANTSRAGSLTNRLATEMARQPVMQMIAGGVGGGVGDATDSPYLGMAASLATPFVATGAKRLVTPVQNQLSAEEARLALLAQQEGIPLTAAQQTGSKPLRYVESIFRDLPLTSGPQRQIDDAQRAAFNSSVMRRAGVNADNAAPQVMDDAFRAIGQQFDDLVRQTPRVNIDPQFEQSVSQVIHQYGRRLPTDVRPVFESYIDDIAQMTNAARQPGVQGVFVDGRTYQNVASDLRAAARNARSNPALQDALSGLSEALDGAMVRSVPNPDIAQAWQTVRRNYRNLLQIDKAMATAPAQDAVSGNVPFGALGNAVRSADPRGFARGRGDLNDVARVGKFIASKEPNSGTPIRTFLTNLMSYGAPVAAGGAGLAGGDLATAAMTTSAALAGPRLTQLLYNSAPVQSYLTNQLAPAALPSSLLLARLLLAQEKGAALAP
jgi:hypothetical protein